jgi:hypothetical protein
MKTNDKDIEKMSYEWCLDASDEHLDPRDFYPSPQSMDAYSAGFKACEAKMLAEAAKDFGEYEKEYWDNETLCGKTYREWTRQDHVEMATSYQRRAFTAGAISQAKRDAERIKRLEDALRKIADYDTLDGDKYISYSDGWHGVAEFAEKALKQGGEK